MADVAPRPVSHRPGIDVIVCNYKTATDLRGFADSYSENSHRSDSVLWVTNVCPEEADRQVGREVSNSNRYLEFDTNVGYARAVNRAASLGEREVIAIFNADTRLSADVLTECHDALIHHPDWGVVGPKQVDERGRCTHAGIVGSSLSPTHRGWQQPDRPGEFNDVVEAVTVSGAAYFIRRDVWERLASCPIYQEVAPEAEGAFLPTQHYYEETACSYHARAHGFKVMYLGIVTMVHKWHQASEVGGWADSQFNESRRFFRRFCDAHSIDHD